MQSCGQEQQELQWNKNTGTNILWRRNYNVWESTWEAEKGVDLFRKEDLASQNLFKAFQTCTHASVLHDVRATKPAQRRQLLQEVIWKKNHTSILVCCVFAVVFLCFCLSDKNSRRLVESDRLRLPTKTGSISRLHVSNSWNSLQGKECCATDTEKVTHCLVTMLSIRAHLDICLSAKGFGNFCIYQPTHFSRFNVRHQRWAQVHTRITIFHTYAL